MKAKSMKLRFLVTLHALFKHTDKEHRINRTKLNAHLKPFGLECSTGRSLNDTLAVLQDFGFDVRYTGAFENQGFWLQDRPLSDEALDSLVFAVSTNPFLSSEQASEILGSLKPLVTVYQEPMLESTVETCDTEWVDDAFFRAYTVVCEAIRQERRVSYTIYRVRYDKETGEVHEVEEWPTLFSPKCIYRAKQRLYMVGYNHTDRRNQAVDLREVADIKLAFKHRTPDEASMKDRLAKMVPEQYVPEARKTVIYKGPAVFRCRGQFVEELYRTFGSPDGAVEKDARCRSTYKVQDAEITAETLLWLSQVPGNGIRIAGPEELRSAVRDYYSKTVDILMDTRLRADAKPKPDNGS